MQNTHAPKVVLTIGGHDSRSGGGVSTDLQVFNKCGVFGYAALTSIVSIFDDEVRVFPVPNDILQEQLDSVLQATSESQIHAVKIGLLTSFEQVRVVRTFVKQLLKTSSSKPKIVIDPVLSIKEDTEFGESADRSDAVQWYTQFAEFANLWTPNAKEAELLGGRIYKTHTYVLVTKPPVDTLYNAHRLIVRAYSTEKIDTHNVNGAGCALSAAITSNLALGKGIETAVADAKKFVTEAIEKGAFGSVWV
ncbi:MAG: bifunctional hydroxymethylpyrimidine kinase/phosphomethylpyrimidine kinase [Bifidobacteriaceae bacterium]|jgi:hydroxymethylpyrimidine/phosphomethylpyrimidine kinase|nr:bifunctional hydroxymethylpyrimidine kinase/phosphomethylpyrimidine kinase [Bifidobacteriaceae bacterium]